MMVEHQSGYAPINGFKMYYEIHGDGKPALYLHSAVLYKQGIAPGMVSLPKNRKWIIPDLRGNGRPSDIERPSSYGELADDIGTLLGKLEVGEVDVFGNCVGGLVGLKLTIRHPKLVSRIATYGIGYKGVMQSNRRDLFQYGQGALKPEADDPGKQWGGFTDDELKSINVPVMIGVGDHDWIRIEHLAEMARLIPMAQLAVISNAGHYAPNAEPQRWVPALERFLDEPLPGLVFATPMTGFHPGENR